jgi:hypothetical protein
MKRLSELSDDRRYFEAESLSIEMLPGTQIRTLRKKFAHFPQVALIAPSNDVLEVLHTGTLHRQSSAY